MLASDFVADMPNAAQELPEGIVIRMRFNHRAAPAALFGPGSGHLRLAYRSANLRKIAGGYSIFRCRAAAFIDSAASGAK